MYREVAFLDKAAVPHCSEELVLRNDLVAVFDQVLKDVERLRRQVDTLVLSYDRTFDRIQKTVSELINLHWEEEVYILLSSNW
jgi:hypothetical protein